ncbi:CueP family metal-binding protein [Agromyces mediolanus]|uniref:CueP family metal-binding protein n=1 Tax=Agromyces mediolanus TaxID=41986 RepID=UPI00203F02B3|nr:CueP family metal-binding protein [Agromyces mediolanus]MCM3658445.1 CueP family metal-binding protein [Agromyces mediolanus]
MSFTHRSTTPAGRRAVTAVSVALAAVLALAACAPSPSPSPLPGAGGAAAPSQAPGALLADYGLDGMDARQIIDRLDALPVEDRPAGLIASVRPDVLALSDQGRELALPMPEEFYVSIAPYRSQTHDCVFHSLTTCLGELPDEEFRVVATDTATGTTVLDETRTSFDNGFIGLWLPRGTQIEVLITDGAGRSASATVDTAALDSASCLTTMRLG